MRKIRRVSRAVIDRLQTQLNANARRAVLRGLPSQNIKAIDLLARTNRTDAGGYACACTRPVSFDTRDAGKDHKATVGHIFPLAAPPIIIRDGRKIRHPGHTKGNTIIECWACNRKQNETRDTPEVAKGHRLGRNDESALLLPKPSPKKKKKTGFRKPPAGYKHFYKKG